MLIKRLDKRQWIEIHQSQSLNVIETGGGSAHTCSFFLHPPPRSARVKDIVRHRRSLYLTTNVCPEEEVSDIHCREIYIITVETSRSDTLLNIVFSCYF